MYRPTKQPTNKQTQKKAILGKPPYRTSQPCTKACGRLVIYHHLYVTTNTQSHPQNMVITTVRGL